MNETFWTMLVLGLLAILLVAAMGQVRYVQMRDQRDHFRRQTYLLRDQLREHRQTRSTELSRRVLAARAMHARGVDQPARDAAVLGFATEARSDFGG